MLNNITEHSTQLLLQIIQQNLVNKLDKLENPYTNTKLGVIIEQSMTTELIVRCVE